MGKYYMETLRTDTAFLVPTGDYHEISVETFYAIIASCKDAEQLLNYVEGKCGFLYLDPKTQPNVFPTIGLTPAQYMYRLTWKDRF